MCGDRSIGEKGGKEFIVQVYYRKRSKGQLEYQLALKLSDNAQWSVFNHPLTISSSSPLPSCPTRYAFKLFQ